MRKPVPFAVQYAKGRSAKSTAETLINYYAEKAPESSKAPVRLIGTAGSRVACDFALPASGLSVVGVHVMNEQLYAFTRSGVYKVDADETCELISPLSITGRVSAADNGKQLVFVDGRRGFYIEDDEVNQILDVDFKAADSVVFIDGYFVLVEKGSGRFFISGLYNVEFDPLDFATAEASPDDAVCVLNDHRELWIFGKTTIEPFYNSGSADFPFQRIAGALIEHGIASPYVAAKADSSVFWLSNDGIVYKALGYAPTRISTHEVETDIKGRDWDSAHAFCYADEGHTFYVLNFPDRTWVYDAATDLWHVRKHVDYGRHHANCYAYAYRRHWIGHHDKPQLLVMDNGIYADGDRPMISEAVAPPLHANGAVVTFHSYEIEAEVGEGGVSGEAANPVAMLAYSDDGGKSWSSDREASIGRMGQHKQRIIWRRLGSARNRSFRVRISAPVKRIVQGVGFVEIT